MLTGVYIGIETGQALVALAIVAAGAVFLMAFLSPEPTHRVGLLVAWLIADVARRIGFPAGSFPILAVLFVGRDSRLVAQHLGPTRLPIVIGLTGIVISMGGQGGAFRVIIGLMMAAYINATKHAIRIRTVMWWAAIAGTIGGIHNILGPQSNYYTYIQGTLSEVRRSVDPSVDPNASAALLLFGFGAAFSLLSIHSSIVAKAVAGAALAVISVATSATGSRTAILVMVGVAGWSILCGRRGASQQSRKGRVVMSALIVWLAGIATYREVFSNQLSHRFYLAQVDAGTRTALWGEAFARWTGSARSFLLGVTDRELMNGDGIGPHNTVLELLLLYGVVGVSAIALILWLARTERSAIPPAFAAAGIGVLGFAGVVSLATAYLPWIAVALVWSRSRKAGARHSVNQ